MKETEREGRNERRRDEVDGDGRRERDAVEYETIASLESQESLEPVGV